MQDVKIMALGGLDESGKNMYIIDINNDLFVVEAGLKYPLGDSQLGVGYQIPDFTYLIDHKENIKGVFITHGHDDVMKGLAHLLKEIKVNVYATALTATILEDDFKQYGLTNKVNIINKKDRLKIVGHTINVFPTMQSIPDSIGLSFDTDNGQIVFLGEFMIDYNTVNQAFEMNINDLSEIGNRPVLALLAESNGATREGYTAPRNRISDKIETYFDNYENRIVISLYEQNLFRIIEILELAKKYNKYVYFHNKKNLDILKAVDKLGYYKVPFNLIIDSKELNRHHDDVVVLISSSGNKVFKLMSKIANNEDKDIKLNNKDLVIIASPVVPGTEKDASSMEDSLYHIDVKIVKFKSADVFSMHGSVEDIKTALHLIKPKYYIPIKGSYSMLYANAQVAMNIGFNPGRIIIVDNGQTIYFEKGRLVSTSETISLTDTFIDSSDNSDVSSIVLKEREALASDGVLIAGVVIDFNTKEVVAGPDIQTRGVIYLKDAQDIIDEVSKILVDTIKENVNNSTYNNMVVRTEVKERITKYISKQTGKRPMVLPAILEVRR